MELLNILIALNALVVVGIPVAGLVRDVSDEVFPEIASTVYAAMLQAVDSASIIITEDAEEFIHSELCNMPIMPMWLEDRLRNFLMNRVVSRLSLAISTSFKQQLPAKVTAVMAVVQKEIYRVDSGVDHLLAEFRNQLREVMRLSRK